MTVQDVFEAVGAHSAGNMSDEDLHELECVACPSAGSCGGQFTANTMACVSEAIGLALPGSAGAPAPYETRDEYAEASGHTVMELIANNLRPRDIVTKDALINAARIIACSGGSTNGAFICRRWLAKQVSILIYLMWLMFLKIRHTLLTQNLAAVCRQGFV